MYWFTMFMGKSRLGCVLIMAYINDSIVDLYVMLFIATIVFHICHQRTSLAWHVDQEVYSLVYNHPF